MMHKYFCCTSSQEPTPELPNGRRVDLPGEESHNLPRRSQVPSSINTPISFGDDVETQEIRGNLAAPAQEASQQVNIRPLA